MKSVFKSKSFLSEEKITKLLFNKRIVVSIVTIILISLPLSILIQSCSNTSLASQPFGQTKKWKLIFDDEFNGKSLDTTKWVSCFRWGTDSGCDSTTTPQSWYLPSNIAVSNGTLKLKAQRQPLTKNGKTYPYTSAMITTGSLDDTGAHAKFLFTYGYMEIRAKVPKGQGLWPAFWTLPTVNGLAEIDVSEILSGASLTTYTNSMTYHYADVTSHTDRSSGAAWTSPVDLSSDFHIYAADWEPDGIHWYVDGIERRAAFTDRKNITAKQMYLLIQLEVGGTWPGSPNAKTPFPSVYEIDYVKVWQHIH